MTSFFCSSYFQGVFPESKSKSVYKPCILPISSAQKTHERKVIQYVQTYVFSFWTGLLYWLMGLHFVLAVLRGKTTLGVFASSPVVKGSSLFSLSHCLYLRLSLWLQLPSSLALPPRFLFSSSFLHALLPGCFLHIFSFLVLSNQTEAEGDEGPQSSHIQNSNYIFLTFVSSLSEIVWGSG